MACLCKMNVIKIFAVLGYYAESIGYTLPSFGDNVISPIPKVQVVQVSWSVNMVPMTFPQTSVKYYHSTVHNIPEELRPNYYGRGSLQLRINVIKWEQATGGVTAVAIIGLSNWLHYTITVGVSMYMPGLNSWTKQRKRHLAAKVIWLEGPWGHLLFCLCVYRHDSSIIRWRLGLKRRKLLDTFQHRQNGYGCCETGTHKIWENMEVKYLY
jgi:hypothetical protein